MKIGLFFGSFNPIHNGHLAIAKSIYNKGYFEQIWFVVSPNNPFKDKEELMNEQDRLNMVKLAIKDFLFLRASDVEFSLPIPSYTIDTLHKLEQQYPDCEFSIILGSDNMKDFYKWKNYEKILERYAIYIYPRNEKENHKYLEHPNIVFLEMPLIPVSATEIRNLLRQKESTKDFLPELVLQYLTSLNI